MTPMFTAIALAAAAQTAPPGTYQMTTAEVQACGAMAVERNNRVAELARRDADLDAKRAALKAQQDQVEAQRAAVDSKKKKSVDQFNALVASANAAATALQPEITARNAYLAENNTFVDSYNAKCSHRSFSPADLAALPADQKAALSGNVTTKTIMVPGTKTTTRRR